MINGSKQGQREMLSVLLHGGAGTFFDGSTELKLPPIKAAMEDQQAGSKHVYEFHGTTGHCSCAVGHTYSAGSIDLNNLPPRCPKCGGVLKPDFIFFGEGIPRDAFDGSFAAAQRCDVCLVIGSTCEVTPAAMVPIEAKKSGATIIEINPSKSAITDRYTDIYIAKKAGEAMTEILAAMNGQG